MLPKEVSALIKNYRELQINGTKVQTPYFRNVKRVRAELRSLVGKGTPEEIVNETLIYAKLRGFKLEGKTEKEIRQFMVGQGIGVDCSGFVSHVYDVWLKASGYKGIYSNLNFPKGRSLFNRLVTRLRPIEHIYSNLLTSSLNTTKVKLQDVQIGDMIRLKGLKHGHHIVVIIEVEQKSFTYVHSSEHYGEKHGVRIGTVEIVKPKGELKQQKWLEMDEKGKCPTYQQLMKDYEDNGLRRPLFHNKLKK